MGLYVTTTSISVILPGYLKGNTTTSDVEGTAVFSEKIDDAEALINSHVSRLYSLPFSPVPPVLRMLTKKIACYFTFQDTAYRSKNENPYFAEYKTALKMIESIGEGKIALADTSGTIVPRQSATRILSNTKNYTPIFGLDDAEKWDRDAGEVEDQSNARS